MKKVMLCACTAVALMFGFGFEVKGMELSETMHNKSRTTIYQLTIVPSVDILHSASGVIFGGLIPESGLLPGLIDQALKMLGGLDYNTCDTAAVAKELKQFFSTTLDIPDFDVVVEVDSRDLIAEMCSNTLRHGYKLVEPQCPTFYESK